MSNRMKLFFVSSMLLFVVSGFSLSTGNLTEAAVESSQLIRIGNSAETEQLLRYVEIDGIAYYEFPAYSGEWQQSNVKYQAVEQEIYPQGSTSLNIRETEPLSARLNSLSAQNFPFVYANVAVDTFGVGITDLDQSNFTVYENGVQQTEFLEITPPEAGSGQRLTDIIMCLDVTGSMGGAITNVKNNMVSFIQTLESSDIDYRVGFITYGDIYYVYNNHNLYSNYEQIIQITNNIRLGEHGIGSGGDWPENQLGAMAASALFNFRPGAQRVIVMITDAPSHSANHVTPWTVETLINERLLPNDITVFPVFDINDSTQRNQYIPIAEATNPNGTYFHLYNNFNDIVTEIGTMVGASYIVRYRTNNPAYDGVIRNVEYQVSYSGETVIAAGSYQPGAAPQISRTAETIALHHQAWPEHTSFVFSVEVIDLIEPFTNSVRLFFKNTDSANYTNIAMTNIERSNIWQGTIEGSFVTPYGLDYYITASDGQTTSTSPSVDAGANPYQLAIMPNEPPIIEHTPVTNAQAHSSVSISAYVSDETLYLEEVKLFYRSYGNLSYTAVDMIAGDADMYSGVIPGSVIADNGAEYYLRATDNYGVSSSSGFADRPHLIETTLEGTIIPGGQVLTTTWTVQNSPYYIMDDIEIPEGEVLTIRSGVEIVFNARKQLSIFGKLTAEDVLFRTSSPIQGWMGLYYDTRDALNRLHGCTIRNAIHPITLNNSKVDIDNLTVDKEAQFVDEIGIHISGIESNVFNNINVFNYARGFVFENNTTRSISTPTLTNVRIRNTASTTREESTGISIIGAVELTLDDAEIEDYDIGIDYQSDGSSSERATPTITNIRIRSSGSTTRSDTKGIVLKNLASVQVGSDDEDSEFLIEGYQIGIEIEADLRLVSSPTLTNIRIRNTGATTRTESKGLVLLGAVELNADDIVLEGYTTGIEYLGNLPLNERATPTLTNIRIRNTGTTTRTETTGIMIVGEISAELTDIVIEDYTVGINYTGAEESNGLRATPTLTNIRIRTTGATTRNNPIGFQLRNLQNPVLNGNIIYVSADDLSDSSYSMGYAVYLDSVNDATITGNTLWGFETGLNSDDSSVQSFDRNIIWVDDVTGLTEPILPFGAVSVNNSIISYSEGVYPGNNNLNVDPLFVDPHRGYFYLDYRSPIKDLNIGALGFDFDFLVWYYETYYPDSITHTLHNGWNLMGVPVISSRTATPATPLSVFGGQLDPFYVHPYYTSIVQMNSPVQTGLNMTGNYQVNHTGLYSVPNRMFPFVGYWVRNFDPEATIQVEGFIDQGGYLIDLPGTPVTNSGWHLVANPYDVPISWGNGIEWHNDADAGETENSQYAIVYRKNPHHNAYHYEYILDESDSVIQPWEGFFVKSNHQNAKLEFSYPVEAVRGELRKSQTPPTFVENNGKEKETDLRSEEWLIVIEAMSSEKSENIVVGANNEALNGLDRYDVPMLPDTPFFRRSGFSFGINNLAWEESPGLYARDTKSIDNVSWTWDLLLNLSNQDEEIYSEEPITVSIAELFNVSNSYHFSLTNLTTGETVDLATDDLLVYPKQLENSEIPLRLTVHTQYLDTEDNLSKLPLLYLHNYPNPFNPETRISFALTEAGKVKLEVFNIRGQRINTLINDVKEAGSHSVIWQGRDEMNRELSSGIYLYRLTLENEVITKKMLLAK